ALGFEMTEEGRISDVDIQRVANDLGEKFTLSEIREMIEAADLNGKDHFFCFSGSSNYTVAATCLIFHLEYHP
ncbi:hypothetical protein GW17_00014368, partial [Ensete ventricosum]